MLENRINNFIIYNYYINILKKVKTIMKITREKIVDELVHNVKIISKEFSNPISRHNKEKFIAPLPVTNIEMKNILHKIITALPLDFFIKYSDDITSAIKQYITKEYILFQAQEDITSDKFADYLLNFIYDLKKNINYALEKNNINILVHI